MQTNEVSVPRSSPSTGQRVRLQTYYVLLISDDLPSADQLKDHFGKIGIEVIIAPHDEDFCDCLSEVRFDVVVLDLNTAAANEMTTCEIIRKGYDLPIIAIDARDSEDRRITGLNIGIDQYVVSPFSLRELSARVRANARRWRGLLRPKRILRTGDLEIDEHSRVTKLRGRTLQLSENEFALLRELAANAGKVMSREQLLQRVKGTATGSFDRSIDVCVSRLRHKLGDARRSPKLLLTIRGQGYMFATAK